MPETRQPEPPLEEEVLRAYDGDPLTRMRVHTLAVAASDEAWTDARVLARHAVTQDVAGQIYRAVGSIGANIAEGYSRSSPRDRARFYEYALGSAREAREWYLRGRAVLGRERWTRATARLNEISRILVAILRRVHRDDPTRRTGFSF